MNITAFTYSLGIAMILWGLNDLKNLADLRKNSIQLYKTRLNAAPNPAASAPIEGTYRTLSARLNTYVVPKYQESAISKIVLGIGIFAMSFIIQA